MKNKKQCPNCGSMNTMTQRVMFFLLSILMLSFGTLFIWLIPIGLAMIFTGVVLFIIGLAPQTGRTRLCHSCKHTWKDHWFLK